MKLIDVITRIPTAGPEARETAPPAAELPNSFAAHVAVLDKEGAIIAVNEAWRRSAHARGSAATDLVGQNYLAVFHEGVAPDDAAVAASAAAGIRAALKGGRTSFTCEYSCHAPSQPRWFRLRATPLGGIRGGVVVSCQDISEQRKDQTALRTSERRFQTLFDQTAVGVAVTDVATGRFVEVNDHFCTILGRQREELERLTFAAVTHPQDIDGDWEIRRQLRAGGIRELTREKRYLRKDGSEVWVNLTVSALWAAGETPGQCIAIIQDIMERKQLEEQFRLAQRMEAIGTLAGGIVHDFNNILAAISGYTELAQMTLHDNPEAHEHLGAVLQATNRATDLARQILLFSHEQTVDRRPIQLRPIVFESLKLLRATIPSSIEFDTSLADDAPFVLADVTQIHQLLMNLGTNAWHAMKDRPGRLQVKLEKCVVDEPLAATQPQLPPGTYTRVTVSDTGCGMDSTTVARIFEPFFTTKPPGEGTGLGLAVVHGIMEGHDGAVTVDSRPGEGTAFCLYFPAQAGETSLTTAEEGEAPRGHGERILVVDDEEVIVEMGRKMLTMLGYEVEVATQPAAALAMVRADPGRFALVLTDQTMPGMTGRMLANELRQIRPELPVILMSGYNLSLPPERSETTGVCQFLVKPITIRTLANAVHASLRASTPHQRSVSSVDG